MFRSTLYFTLSASILSLAAAFLAEYGFGLKPCELCMAQRVPYAVVIVLSLLALKKVSYQKYVLYLIAVSFLIDGGIASYHSAVEKHIVEGPTACTSSASDHKETVDELLQRLHSAPVVACDKPQWEFHGITMASMNAVWSFFLSVSTIVMMRKKTNA